MNLDSDNNAAAAAPVGPETDMRVMHSFLQWNRAQPTPPVTVTREYHIARKVLELLKLELGAVAYDGGVDNMPNIESERPGFEAWVSASGRAHMLGRDERGWYKDLTITAWWSAWQGRATYEAAQRRVLSLPPSDRSVLLTAATLISGQFETTVTPEPVSAVVQKLIELAAAPVPAVPTQAITLDAHQLKQALALAWPDGDADPVQGFTVVTLCRQPAGIASDEDGAVVQMPEGLYLSFDDMPDEGMQQLMEIPDPRATVEPTAQELELTPDTAEELPVARKFPDSAYALVDPAYELLDNGLLRNRATGVVRPKMYSGLPIPFKVGDTVKVVDGSHQHPLGKVGKITHIYEDIVYLEGIACCWERLDPVPPALPAPAPSELRAWVERRFAGSEMVHQTLSLKKMSAEHRAQLEKHYRLEVIELAPVAKGMDVGQEKSAARNWLRVSGKLPMVGWTLSDAYTEGWLAHALAQLGASTASAAQRGDNKVCRKPEGCADAWKCSSAAVGDCGARNAPLEPLGYRGRPRQENGVLLDWQSLDVTTDVEAQAWAEKAGNGVWERTTSA